MMEQVTTLIRIKRPLGNDSFENIVVSAKRRCLDTQSSSTDIPHTDTILQKLCTVEKENDPFEEDLKKVIAKNVKTYQDLKSNFKLAPLDLSTKKCRELAKQTSSENRYKLICSRRHMQSEDLPKEHASTLNVNLYDVFKEVNSAVTPFEDAITCNGIPMKTEKTENYVYDLYFTSVPLEFQSLTNNIFEIQCFSNTPMLMYDEDSDSDKLEDDDDENDESNWRNDYPEEYSSHSEDDDDYLSSYMRRATLDSGDESYDDVNEDCWF